MRRLEVPQCPKTMATALFLVAMALSLCTPVTAQSPDLGRLIKDAERATKAYLEEAIVPEGPCKDKYRPIPEDHLLIPRDRLRAINPRELESQIQQLRQEKKQEEQSLVQIKEGQQDAIFASLRQRYGGKVGQSKVTQQESWVIVITPWLFGTLVTSYPKDIPADVGRKLDVSFTPAVFGPEAFRPSIKIRPARYAGPAIPKTLELNPRNVSIGTKDAQFQLGQWETIDPVKEIRWTWEAKPSSQFGGAEFDIIMEAGPEENSRGLASVTAARLPIKVGLDPGKTWWEVYGNLVTAIVGAAVGAVLAWLLSGRGEASAKVPPQNSKSV